MSESVGRVVTSNYNQYPDRNGRERYYNHLYPENVRYKISGRYKLTTLTPEVSQNWSF